MKGDRLPVGVLPSAGLTAAFWGVSGSSGYGNPQKPSAVPFLAAAAAFAVLLIGLRL